MDPPNSSIQVNDSQCPGIVISEASTYKVEWIPRPTAKLSSETDATYVPYNHSYILKTVCEGISEHVDLDLQGVSTPLTRLNCLLICFRATTFPDHV